MNNHDTTHRGLIAATLDERRTGNEEVRFLNHNAALARVDHGASFERAIVDMIYALARYADDHHGRYESGIGQDGVLGADWAQAVNAVRGLLNGETGRLDCGTVDGLLCKMLELEGVES